MHPEPTVSEQKRQNLKKKYYFSTKKLKFSLKISFVLLRKHNNVKKSCFDYFDEKRKFEGLPNLKKIEEF